MIKITVVIPNYNGIKYLEDCLCALYNQVEDTPAFEALVVDNGSTDGSVEMLQNRLPQTKLIRLSENTGFCHAVNVGIQASEGPYVILLNNDTKPDTGFVKALYEAIQARERAFSVSAKMLMWDRPELIDDAGDRYCVFGWAYARGKGKPASDYDKPVEIFAACGGAAIYRRAVLEEIGLFDEAHFAYLEDIDIGYRAKLYGYRNYYEPKAEVLHYGSASSGSRYNVWKTGLASANSVYLIWKNMPFLQWLLNFPFLLLGFATKAVFFCKKGMGGFYVKGLLAGIRKSFSRQGRQAKLPFRVKNLWNYFVIQWQMYMAVFQILMKT